MREGEAVGGLGGSGAVSHHNTEQEKKDERERRVADRGRNPELTCGKKQRRLCRVKGSETDTMRRSVSWTVETVGQ